MEGRAALLVRTGGAPDPFALKGHRIDDSHDCSGGPSDALRCLYHRHTTKDASELAHSLQTKLCLVDGREDVDDVVVPFGSVVVAAVRPCLIICTHPTVRTFISTRGTTTRHRSWQVLG